MNHHFQWKLITKQNLISNDYLLEPDLLLNNEPHCLALWMMNLPSLSDELIRNSGVSFRSLGRLYVNDKLSHQADYLSINNAILPGGLSGCESFRSELLTKKCKQNSYKFVSIPNEPNDFTEANLDRKFWNQTWMLTRNL